MTWYFGLRHGEFFKITMTADFRGLGIPFIRGFLITIHWQRFLSCKPFDSSTALELRANNVHLYWISGKIVRDCFKHFNHQFSYSCETYCHLVYQNSWLFVQNNRAKLRICFLSTWNVNFSICWYSTTACSCIQLIMLCQNNTESFSSSFQPV